MAEERTLVSFDWAIKYLLKNKADYVILEGFLTTLLGKKIKIQSLNDSGGTKETAKDKSNCVDVLAVEEDGSLIIVELQFASELDYFHRMLYGSSKGITDHIKEGMPYSEVKKVYSVNIVYFDLGVGKDYIYHGTTAFRGLHSKDELELSLLQKEKFLKSDISEIFPEYYILKIDLFRNVVKDKLDEWMYYLKNTEIKPDFDAPGLKEATHRLWYSQLSKAERDSYDWHVHVRRSNKSSFDTARLEGKVELRDEVLSLIAQGYSLEQIEERLKSQA